MFIRLTLIFSSTLRYLKVGSLWRERRSNFRDMTNILQGTTCSLFHAPFGIVSLPSYYDHNKERERFLYQEIFQMIMFIRLTLIFSSTLRYLKVGSLWRERQSNFGHMADILQGIACSLFHAPFAPSIYHLTMIVMRREKDSFQMIM